MRRKVILCMIAGLMSALFVAGCGVSEEKTASDFTVDILSTGKSDCAVIRLDGLVILSDTADADDYTQIVRCLEGYGAERIDYMILSHFDKDHIGSAAVLLQKYPVGQILTPDYTENSEEYAALEAAVKETDTPWLRLTEDYAVTTEHGGFLADPPDMDYGDDNNNSVVTTVTWEGHRLLFLGDARKTRIEEFNKQAEDAYDFIKLPHHGDSSKPLLRLIRETMPRWTAETVSPQEEIEEDLVSLLRELDIPLLLSYEGPIHLLWDGTDLALEQ